MHITEEHVFMITTSEEPLTPAIDQDRFEETQVPTAVPTDNDGHPIEEFSSETRVARDGQAYTFAEFDRHYSQYSSWLTMVRWNEALSEPMPLNNSRETAPASASQQQVTGPLNDPGPFGIARGNLSSSGLSHQRSTSTSELE